MDYEALSADELQPVGSDLEHSDVSDDGVRRDEVRSMDETRKWSDRSYSQKISRDVSIRRKPIPRKLPSQLRYPGVPALNSETSDLVYCVTRNVHELDIILSQWGVSLW